MLNEPDPYFPFVLGTAVTVGVTTSKIIDMRNNGESLEDQVLVGADAVIDIGVGVAALFGGPVVWVGAALYYGADYLADGNLLQWSYQGIFGRKEDEPILDSSGDFK